MAQKDGMRRNTGSGNDSFDGRDLLVGRPEGAEARPPAEPAKSAPTPPPPTSPQPAAHDDAIREILATVQTIAARLDEHRETPGPEDERAEALAREAAALTKAVADARGALAKAVELAGRPDGAAEAAQVLAKGVAALRAQGEALDQRLQVTGQKANQTGWQAETVAQGIKEMMPAAKSLESSLRIHTENMSRINRDHRRRRWITGLSIGAASFVFFVLGLVLQRETDFVSFGDPRHEWNDFVLEEYAPTIAGCASWARINQQTIKCQLYLDPSLEVTIPLYPDATVEEVPSGERAAPSAGQ